MSTHHFGFGLHVNEKKKEKEEEKLSELVLHQRRENHQTML